MLAKGEAERNRLLVVTDAEIRARTRNEGRSIAQEYIFNYLNEKVPNLPKSVFDLESYDHESGVFSSELIGDDTFEIWSSRLNEPDSTIPGRSWSLELTIGKQSEHLYFGSRLSCFSRHLDFDFEPSVPRVYRELTSRGILFGDGIKLSRDPIDITSTEETDWIVALINNRKRWRNIIAIACDERGTCAINPFFFAERLCGIAHVARIYPEAAFYLSDAVGRYLSVFDMGIRVYRPTESIDLDEPLKHSLFTRNHLARVDQKQLQNSIAFDAFRASVDRNVTRQAIPSFTQIKSAGASLRLAQIRESSGSKSTVATLTEQLEAALKARTAAEAQAAEALNLAVQEEHSRVEAETERDQEKARATAIGYRVRFLEQQLEHSAAQIKLEAPKTFEDIQNWVQSKYAGRIRLHSRALRGLKNAQYEDLDLVCEILDLLGTEYVDSKRGNSECWQRFEEGLKNKGVQISRSISESRAGQEGEEYFVKNRNRRQFLEWHLKKGFSRNPKKDLRIYFFWDEEDEEVVIGHLPGHVDNRLT